MEEIELKLPDLKAIGIIENSFKEPVRPELIAREISTIRVFPQFVKGLSGLKEGSLIVVLFVFHKSEGYKLMIHPRGDPRNPEKGVFLTCSPFRPNPIGLSLVKVVELNPSEIKVMGLDALDGSPVIDIKPAIPLFKFFKEMMRGEKDSSL